MILFVFLLQLFLVPAQARILTFCSEVWEPYTIKNSQGVIDRGITHDILKKAAEELGYKLAIEEVSFADRCFALGRTGEIDGSLFTTEVGKSKKMFYFERPLEYWSLNVMVPQDSTVHHYTSLRQFKGKRIGFTKGYGYPDQIKNFKKWTVEEENETVLNMRKLSAKRIDLYIDDPYQATETIKREKLKVRILYPPVAVLPLYVEIKERSLYEKLNKKVNELAASGYVDQIYQKYTGKSFKDFLKGPNL